MKASCFIIFLFSAAFVNLAASGITSNHIDDSELRYPPPLNLSRLFPTNILRNIFNFNITSLDHSLENGTNRINSQVSSVVSMLRRLFRFMITNALAISPLRASTISTTTEKFSYDDDDDSKVSIDLPIFSVSNDTLELDETTTTSTTTTSTITPENTDTTTTSEESTNDL